MDMAFPFWIRILVDIIVSVISSVAEIRKVEFNIKT